MSKRKLILVMLACLLVLGCTACGDSNDAPSGTEAADVSITDHRNRCCGNMDTSIPVRGYYS